MVEPDQQVWIGVSVKDIFNRAQNLRQRFRIQLGCSTRAVRIAG
jgi:hypothetical protein